MPRLTRFFIKTAMIYLAAALLLGAVLAARSVWTLPTWMGGFGPIYFHAFLVGWVTQLIFGVVFWLFPVQDKVRPRGSESLGWATYILLNVGLALRVIAEPIQVARPHPFWGWLLVLSALLQWLAGIGFVINSWRRVQPSPRERLEASKQ
jgi:hypothetical protein